MRRIATLLTVLSIVLMTGCSLQDQVTRGTIKDLSNLSNCGFVVETDAGEVLEPSNLADFDSNPVEGKRVKLTYGVLEGVNSNCQAGRIVEILKYRELK